MNYSVVSEYTMKLMGLKTNVVVCRSVQTGTGSTDIIGARSHKCMGSVAVGGH